MNQAVLEATKDFLEKTLMWRKELSPINIVKAQTEYALTIPAPEVTHAKIEKILWLKIENLTKAGQVEYYLKPDETAVVLTEEPARNITNGLKVLLALNMKNTGTEMDDLIYARYRPTIAARAKMYLYNEKDKPYSDSEKAQLSRLEYLVGIERAMHELNKQRGTGDLTVRPNPLFM